MQHRKYILYADDDSDDRNWVNDACRGIDGSLNVHFLENGREVLEHLNNDPQNLPSLIVLDLNMPELDGRQTLQRLKAKQEFKKIPVVIVTTSSNKMDQEICKKLGADLYLIKPDTHQAWQNIAKQLQVFL